MTRETRIGLLVGLVFIVAFGVLLSELTGRSGPTPPPPTATAEHVENYLHTPTIEEAPEATVGPLVAEAGPARARSDGGGVAVVEADVLRPDHGRAPVIETISTEVRPPPALLTAALAPVTRTAVLAGVPVGTVGSGTPPAGGAAVATAVPGGKTYKVQAGDRLMTLAAKFYGKGQEKQYKRILDANKKTIPDERSLVVGTEIIIPPPEGAAAPAGGTGAASAAGGYGTPPAPAVAAGGTATTGDRGRYAEVGVDGLRDVLGGRKPAGAGTGSSGATTAGGTTGAGAGAVVAGTGAGGTSAAGTSATAGKMYTTRQGDTFSKIARDQLRDGSFKTVQKLIDLNRGRVSNPNRLPTGLEIQLPA